MNWLSSRLRAAYSSMQAPAACSTTSASSDLAQEELAAWSRSAGLLSGTGSAEDELKTRVPSEVGDDFRKLSRSLGMNTSEFLRIVVLTRLYGVEGVARMMAEQVARVAGEGPEKARTL